MRLTIWLAALLAATPVLAQNKSPFQGAMPNTLIFDAGWQMTPEEDRCVLTHRGAGVGQDLVVIAARHQDDVVLGLILPAKGAYTSPVQLTVVAQATEAKQIGRVTFNPTTGALGTLLMANWPADRLLPRMTQAIRFNFYAPDGHLARSVKMAGSVAAVEALNRCRGTDPTAPRASNDEARPHVIDVGWVPEFDDKICSIKRLTARGNELDLFFGRRQGMVLVYRLARGARLAPGTRISAQLSLWHLASENGSITDQYNLPTVEMHMAAGGDIPLMFGPLPSGLVDKLRDDHWNAIGFGPANSGPIDIDDTVHTGGSATAIADWNKCIDKLKG